MVGPIVFTSNEIRMLHYLKRHGPIVKGKEKGSLLNRIAEAVPLTPGTTRAVLRSLEVKCVILRTYSKGGAAKFGENKGSLLVKVELIEPNMILPPMPRSLPPIVVDAQENEELYQRTTIEPSPDAVILALLGRNEELQDQITKLQDVIMQLQGQVNAMKQDQTRKVPEHLTSRIRDALTPEQWDQLSHSGKR